MDHLGNVSQFQKEDRTAGAFDTKRTSLQGNVHHTARRKSLAVAVVDLALEKPELSPRELAITFTETRRYFLSEVTV